MMLAALLGLVGLFVLLALVRAGLVVIGRDAKKAAAIGAGVLGLVVLLRAPWLGVLGLVSAGVLWAWASQPARAMWREDPAEAQARALLGVARGANADAIHTAHREKIRAAHPDAGGSTTQAAALNAARDRLLARLR